MNQVFLGRYSVLVLVWTTLAVLAACGDAKQAEHSKSIDQSITSPEQAAARLRALFFAQDARTGVLEGETLLARFDSDAELLAWHVLNLSRAGYGERASAHSRALLESKAENPWSKFAFAAALLWAQDSSTDELLDATSAALQASSTHPDFIWIHAEALRLRNRRDEALSLLARHDRLLNSSPELLNVQASALVQKALADPQNHSKISAALDTFDRALELDPQNLNAHYLQAKFLLRIGRPFEAYSLAKTAASLSNAIDVQIAYWSSVLNRRDLTLQEKRAEIGEHIRQLLRSREENYELLWAASIAYEKLDMPAEGRRLQERVLDSDLEGPAGEEILMSWIDALRNQGGGDSSELRQALREFLARKPHYNLRLYDQAQRMLFALLKDDPNAESQELLQLVRDMSHGSVLARTVAYSEGVLALASRESLLRDAEAMITTALASIAAVLAGDEPIGRDDLRPGQNVPGQIEGSLRDALGLVYLNQGREDEAEREWLAAYEISGTQPSTILHLGELYERRGRFELAESFYIKCSALPQTVNEPCAKALQDYYLRRTGSIEGFENYLDRVRDRVDRERYERLLDEKVSTAEIVPAINLRALDGEFVSLDLKGKLAVIKFWGLWCEPCRVEMPAFARFAERYSEVDDVVIVTINNDPNPETVRDWMKNHGYNFQVLLDSGASLEEKVSAIPTAWFVDRNGRKVFEVEGMIGDLEEEYSARIQFMQSAGTYPPVTTETGALSGH